MANCIARWSLVTAVFFLVGPAARAQTDYTEPPPAQLPMSQRDYPPPRQPPSVQPPSNQSSIPGTAMQPRPWGQAAGFRMDCARDVQRFCYGVQPGAGRLVRCLLSHGVKLSPACMSRVAALRPALGLPSPSPQNAQRAGLASPGGQAVTASSLRASCGPDMKKLCTGVAKENSDVVKCLSSHPMELSPTCVAFFKEMPAPRAASKSAPGIVPAVPKTMAPASSPPAAAGASPATNAAAGASPAAKTAAAAGASTAPNTPAVVGPSPAANGPPVIGAPAIPQ
jgi:hypothetical protein